jgi:hypothetical protein
MRLHACTTCSTYATSSTTCCCWWLADASTCPALLLLLLWLRDAILPLLRRPPAALLRLLLLLGLQGAQKNICWLQVAVDIAPAVDVVEAQQQLHQQGTFQVPRGRRCSRHSTSRRCLSTCSSRIITCVPGSCVRVRTATDEATSVGTDVTGYGVTSNQQVEGSDPAQLGAPTDATAHQSLLRLLLCMVCYQEDHHQQQHQAGPFLTCAPGRRHLAQETIQCDAGDILHAD